MKMKRVLCAVLSVVMTVGLLAGCNGGSKSSSEAAAQFKETDEKLELKWLGCPTNAGSSEGTLPELLLEEKFNVEIKPYFYEWDGQFNDKKTMLMAGGDIPDLIYEMDPINMFYDVDQDFIVEVPYETIEKYAPTYFNYVKETAPASILYGRYDGKNWGVPNLSSSAKYSQATVYRKDWLDKLGLEVPETLDEYHDVLYAFANNDPDGNGKKDTYGLSVDGALFQWYFPHVFLAYGILPFDWQEVDGEIVYGGTREECKEVLSLLATWYKEGIIHPDFNIGTKDKEKMIAGQLGHTISGYIDESQDDALSKLIKAQNPKAELTYGPLPKGPNGDSGIRTYGQPQNVLSFGNTEGYEVKVPRILQIFEGIFNDKDLYMKLKIGNEGEQYVKADENTISSNNFVMTKDYNTYDKYRVKGFDTNISNPGFFTPVSTDFDTWKSTKSDTYLNYAETYGKPENNVTDFFYKPDIMPSASDYLTDYQTQQIALICSIVTGEKPVDAWDTFVNDFNNGGGKIMTEEANDMLKEYEGICKELNIKID